MERNKQPRKVNNTISRGRFLSVSLLFTGCLVTLNLSRHPLLLSLGGDATFRSPQILAVSDKSKDFTAAINNHTIFANTCLTRPGTEKKIPVKIAFMGDSRMRQVYRALERFIKTGLLPEKYGSQPPVHHKLSWIDNKTKASIEYYWTPEPKDIASILANNKGKRFKEFDVLVIGAGVHTIIKASKINSTKKIVDDVIRSYTNQLESMIPLLPRHNASSKHPLIVWMMQPKTNETLLDPHHKPAKNEILDRLNDMAQILLMKSAAQIRFWTNFRATAKSHRDGVHFDPKSLALATRALQKCICTIGISGGPNMALTYPP